MRGLTLLLTIMVLVLVAPAAAPAQGTGGADPTAAPAPTPAPAPGDPVVTGGAQYGVDPTATPRTFVAGTKAKRLRTGYAAAPQDAPVEVQNAIFAANDIVGRPYTYGGGHNRTFSSTGYDCSGAISYALHGGSLLDAPLDSSSFESWGARGKGAWITVFANSGHAYAVIAGLRLDTSAAGERRSSGKGPRWRKNARRQRGFKRRHPDGF